jgi:hypothetical protein
LQAQVQELSRITLDLVKEAHELAGQMKNIEKRFDDKDKMIDAVIKMRIAEELEKIRAERADIRLKRRSKKVSAAQPGIGAG